MSSWHETEQILPAQLSPLSPPFIAQIPIVKRINFPQVTLINSSQLQFW